MVNGRGPYRFFIDTDEEFSTITSGVVKAAGVTKSYDDALVDSISIGSARLRHFRMTIKKHIDGADGLLGLDAYSDLLLTLDFPHSRIRLERGTLPAANDHDVFTTNSFGGATVVNMQVAGTRVQALLDTQLDAAFDMPHRWASDKYGIDTLMFVKPPVTVENIHGPDNEDVKGMAGRLKSDIRIGDLIFDQPVIFIPSEIPNIWYVGAGALREAVVTLDQHHNLLRITRLTQTHVAPPPPLRMNCWIMSVQNGNRVVHRILPGDEAERQGVKVGDVIVSINGRPNASVDDSAWLALNHGDQPLQIVARRGTETKQFTLTPQLVVP
jgi:hypothetical protein